MLCLSGSNSRDVARARMRALGVCSSAIPVATDEKASIDSTPEEMWLQELGDAGLATPLVSLLSDAFTSWQDSVRRRCSQDENARHLDGAVLTKYTGNEEKKEDCSELLSGQEYMGSPAKTPLVSGFEETESLRNVLNLHLELSKLDPILGEEIGRAGSHAVISRLIQFDLTSELKNASIKEEDEDVVMELQDLACEIGSLSGGAFPIKVSPFTLEELRGRLPLCFSVSPADYTDLPEIGGDDQKKSQCVLINQVTTRQSAQEDVGFVMWPSAVALSSWLVTNPSFVRNKSVLELGAGCGLVGLIAAGIVADAKRSRHQEGTIKDQSPVILTDFNDVVIQNASRNIKLNDLSDVATTAKLDFYSQRGDNEAGGWLDESNKVRDPVDVILAADVICKPEDAIAVANTIHDALCPGGVAVAISADRKHRFGVDKFKSECCRVGLRVDVSNVADLYGGGLVSSPLGSGGKSGIEQTSGYVEGMTLTMFCIRKSDRLS